MPNAAQAGPVYPPPNAGREVYNQLATDSLHPKHTTSLKYPFCSLIENDQTKQIKLLGPEDADQRYPYEELVDEAAVIRNASQLNKNESSFFVFNQVNIQTMTFRNNDTVPKLASMRPGNDGLTRLLHDLKAYEQTVGKTTLKMVIFAPIDNLDDWRSIVVRIERKSRASAGNGDWSENTRTYDFPLHRLEGLSDDNAVVSMMLHLIFRMSTRAVRHVRYWLTRSEAIEAGDEWYFKPSRKVSFTDALEPLLDPVSAEELLNLAAGDKDAADDDRVQPNECPICNEPYTFHPTAPHRPVRLRPCGHVYGYECIRTWCNTEIREHGRLMVQQCPCRCKLFDGTAILRREQDGTYYNLPHFTAYENFEVSCADLDAATPVRQVSDRSLTIQAEVMKHALHAFTEGALLEDTDSTPFNLQTVRYAEAQLAIAAIAEFLTVNDGCRLIYGCLWDYLQIIIADELLAEFKRTMSPRFLDEEERGNMNVAHWARHRAAPVRKGFYEFVERLIHRMVMFQELRACQCSPGFHAHGARMFWNPEDCAVEERRTRELHEEMRDLMAGA